MNGRYEITDRLLYLMDCETVTLKSYKEKWERGRSQSTARKTKKLLKI